MEEELKSFIKKIQSEADELDDLASGESRTASLVYSGKADGYREVADKLTKLLTSN